MRACGKCGSGGGFDEGNEDLLFSEVQLAYGIIEWLCIDCRKDWSAKLAFSPLSDEYSRAKFELEWYQAKHAVSGNCSLDEGFKLLDRINELDDKISKLAKRWLSSRDSC